VSRVRIGGLVAIALLTLGRRADAQERELSARVESARDPGAEACMTDAALVRAVERRLRRPVFRGSAPDLTVRVHFDRPDNTFRVRLELADAKGPLGTRELATEAKHCSALDDSLALIVALLVDAPPEREAAVAPAAEASATEPQPVRALPKRAPTSILLPAETLAPRESVRLGARASATGAFGLLPGVALGLELGLEVRFPHVPRVVVLAGGFLSKRESVAGRDAGATLAVHRAGLFLCPELASSGSLAIEACAGQYVGRFTADGFGFARNLGTERLYFAVAAGADLRVGAAGWLDILLGVRAELPLTRDEFTGRMAQGEVIPVFRQSVVAGAVQTGLGAHF
jgi:hypothetical protein